MAELEVLRRVRLTPQHIPTGNTRHYVGGQLMGKPASLEIAKSDEGYFLFYLDDSGTAGTDTWHMTLDDALSQAEFEFTVTAEEWEVLAPR